MEIFKLNKSQATLNILSDTGYLEHFAIENVHSIFSATALDPCTKFTSLVSYESNTKIITVRFD